MSSGSLTRASFLAAFLGAAALSIAPNAYAARNTEVEQFVQSNATAALRTLSDRSMNDAQRRQNFNRLMAEFADMPRIGSFVLGRYGASLRADTTLRNEWNSAFQDYSIAVYEDRLGAYSGSGIRVTDSVERVAGRDVIVSSEIQPRGGGRPLPVQWRMLRSGDTWKVVDVSLIIDGNQIWLAQQQQSEFLAVLGRNNGDVHALIDNLRQVTATMRQRTVART